MRSGGVGKEGGHSSDLIRSEIPDFACIVKQETRAKSMGSMVANSMDTRQSKLEYIVSRVLARQ